MAVDHKLVFNQRHDFGECIGDGFKFVRINFSAILTGLLYYILPAFFLFGIPAYYIFKSSEFQTNFDIFNWFEKYGMWLIVMAIALFILFVIYKVVIYAIIQSYVENDNQKVSHENMWVLIKKNALKVSGITLLYSLGMLIINLTLLFLASSFSFFEFIRFCLNVFLSLVLQYSAYIYVTEDYSLMGSLRKSWQLVMGDFWTTLGVTFVSSIISYFAISIFLIPLYIFVAFVGFSSGINDFGGISDYFYLIGLYSIVFFIVGLLLFSYFYSAIFLKYYDLIQKNDSTHLYEKIASIGSNQESMFENEGEY